MSLQAGRAIKDSATPAVLSTFDTLRVVASPHPFSDRTVDMEMEVGGTVLDLMRAAGCDKALLGHAHVFITDRAMTRDLAYIPRENWHRVRPKPGMYLSIRVVPTGGGGGGGKNPLRTILTIAVIAAAFVVPQLSVFQFGNLGNLGGLLSKDLFLGQILAGVATTLVGNAIVNAIAPIQPPKLSEVSGKLFAEATSPTLTITGSQNRIVAGAPVVSVMGEARLFPMMRTDAPPYTEVLGNEQFLRQFFDLGYGPLELIEERIGTVPLAQYEGVEGNFLPGFDNDPPPKLYTNTIRQDGYSLKLTAASGARMVESRIDANEVTGDLSFNGLTTFDQLGNPGSRTVQVKIEYRKAGTADPLTLHSTETITAATTSLFIHPFRIVMPSKGRYEVYFTRLTGDTTSTQIRDECTLTALRTVTYTPPKIPKGRSGKELRIKATNQLNGIVQSYNCIPRRLFPVWNGATWSAPQATKNPAWLALGIMRLPGKGNAKPVPDSLIDLPTWLAFAQWCDRLDQNGEPMFRCSGVIDTRGTVEEAVNVILATARAWLERVDGKYSVGWDQEQATTVQMFTPRNSWGFEYERNFVDLPHALKGKFINPAKDWQQDEVIVYNDGYNESNATEFETIEYFLVDRASQVWRELTYRWADTKLRPAKYFLNSDMEHLQVRRGKKVRVSNRLMRWGLGEGRIKSLAVDGSGNVTSLTLDEKLTLEAGKSYALRIRKANGTQIVATLPTPGTTTETATVTFNPAIPAVDAPAKGDLAVFGVAGGLETVSLIVKNIVRLDDVNARLELVDEAPAVHTADTVPLPAFDPQQTFAGRLAIPEPPAPVIADIVSDERAMVPSPAGGWVSGIDVYLAPQSGVAVDVGSIEGRFRRKGSNEPWSRASASPFANKIRLAPVEEGVDYEFSLVAASTTRPGIVSKPTYVASHVVIGRLAAPPTPAVVTLNDNKVDSPGYVPPFDIAGFRVSYKLGDNRVYQGAISAHPAIGAVDLPFDVSHLPAGTVTIFLTAVDTSDNESAPAVIVKEITGPVRTNIVETRDYRVLAWPGTIAGGSVLAGDIVANDLAPFVPADDGAPFVPAADSAAFVPDDATGSFATLSYVASFQPDRKWLPAQLTLDRDFAGQAAIEVRTDTDAIFVPGDDAEPFVPADDAAPFVPALGPWQAFPGALELKPQTYDLRVSIAGGNVRGVVLQLKAVVDVDDVEEFFQNLAVAAGGTRLPLTKTYKSGVVDPGITLLADGGSAVGVRVTLDGVPPGPLVECLNTAGSSVAGRINARPRGY